MANQPIRYITMPNGDVLSSGGPQFCTCDTDSTTQTKVITIKNVDPYTIPIGYTLNVLMESAQLYDGTPKLQVNARIKSGSAYQTVMVLPASDIYRAERNPASKNAWQMGDVLTLVHDVVSVEVGDEEYTDADIWYIVGCSRIGTISVNGVGVTPDTKRNVDIVETDPTVPSWAKQSTKPTYTASEVGALADPYVLSDVDMTKSDNGISETVFKTVRFIDDNDNAVAHITVQARPDGSTSLSLFTVNYRNQTNYASGIRIVQQKNGTLTYTVNEADAFRDAIGVYSADEIDSMVATLAETKSYLGIS